MLKSKSENNMKRINKFEINQKKLIKNEELRYLKGGSGIYKCYKYGSAGGWCNTYLTDVWAYDCESALYLCTSLGGGCVECSSY